MLEILEDLNWGIFLVLFAVGFIVMLVAFKIWASMDFEIGLVNKIIILTVFPALGALGFTWWLGNS